MTRAAKPEPEELERRIQHALAEASRMFEAREYFEAHEVLELVWLHTHGVEKHFLGGVILCASALHKRRNQLNANAAERILQRALFRLSHVPDVYRGADVRALERLTRAGLVDLEMTTRLPWFGKG